MRVVLPGVCLLLSACTPWRAEYLDGLLDREAQPEIERRPGPPTARITQGKGELWVYRFGAPSMYVTPTGAAGSLAVGTASCSESVLRFDEERVLRRWVQQACCTPARAIN
jgi:hypothetical protein